MKIFADLHNHSKYSRATSSIMDVEHQSKYGLIKGLNLLGTGDFSHPKWFKELKSKLVSSNNGIYEFNGMKWVLSTEISNIYSVDEPKNGVSVKKVHHVILSPNFEIAEQIQELLSKHGRIDYDGRPIFGRWTSQELVQDLMNISKRIFIFPAHIWTPWFSLFGSNSGYNNIKECYGKELKHIHALETGLSSDPSMNWRCSQLDNFTLISNSDSHSPWPWRLGREANAFELKELTYDALIDAIKTKKGFKFTIETIPAYGKYHYDGHRNCNIALTPEETKKFNGICPVCKKPLTIGVENRVEELSDMPLGRKPKNAIPFKKLLPLHELIKYDLNISSLNSKKIWELYNSLIKKFGNEFNILLNVSKDKLEEKGVNKLLAKLIIMNRNEELEIEPGYDGVYGKIKYVNNKKDNEKKSQKTLDFY